MKDLKKLEKQKALELIDSYYNNDIESELYSLYRLQAIQCAIICVNNIINFENQLVILDFEKHRFWIRVRIELAKEYSKQQKEDYKHKNLDL